MNEVIIIVILLLMIKVYGFFETLMIRNAMVTELIFNIDNSRVPMKETKQLVEIVKTINKGK